MGAKQSLPKVTAQDKAILDLKLQRDKLRQYQKAIQVVLDREHAIAKAHLATGQKDRAVIALRRKKYQESLLVKTDKQMETLEQLVSTIEFSLVEVSVLHGLKQGNEVLKEIHKEMNLESVEKLLEETHEAREYQREIGDMLANNLTLDEEDAVQDELRQLEAEAVCPLFVFKLRDVLNGCSLAGPGRDRGTTSPITACTDDTTYARDKFVPTPYIPSEFTYILSSI
ncbi:Snf7-domain-containing protein [Macrolepiota fuliginosa MF-IS2]|uniref:Snf7-domain-containing protein n=1 Tax=Macrolepiota fuliginosa MF-IS2 TaxID=1400762 RepID=A0A9P6CBG0_9AGAR|nr:Snf7-domain-containing protein [Macrolepiota fuliginosa MF-IS2]